MAGRDGFAPLGAIRVLFFWFVGKDGVGVAVGVGVEAGSRGGM